MKQLFRTLLIVAMLLALTACAPTEEGDAQSTSTSTDAPTEMPEVESSDVPEESSGTPEEPNAPAIRDEITFRTLQRNGTDVYGQVSNETTSFSFIDEVAVSGKATYVVCLDLYGIETALTKIVPLESGDNVFYVLEQVGESVKLYTVTIRRLPLYTVSFETNCNEEVAPQTVEEGELVTLPALSKSGYIFAGWYNGDKLFSAEAVASFAPEESLTLTAYWAPVEDLLEHFIYTFTEDTCTIVGVKDKTAASYEIPATVTHIGESAFQDCTNLTTITIPESVSGIGFGAFRNCTSLASITLPFVGKTKNELFDSTHLGYVFGAPSDAENESFVPASLRLVTVTGGASIRRSAFEGCTSLAEIVLPESLTSIESSAFKGCTSLVSLTIPDSVTSIEFATFEGCASLVSLTIPKNVTIIDDRAFMGCVSLTSFTIPENVKKIGNRAFENCKRLVEVYDLSPHVTITVGDYENGQIANHALVVHTEKDAESRLWTDANGYQFYEGGDTRRLIRYTGSRTALTLPKTCNGKNYEIHRYAFGACASLTSVTIPESVTGIGVEAFHGCASLTSVVVPESVTGIGYSAFGDCTSLTSITLPFVGESKNGTTYHTDFGYIFGAMSYLDNHCIPASLHFVTITSVTSIANDAFNNCNSLTKITLPEGVTDIGLSAFENCIALSSIVIPKSVENIAFDAFNECTALTCVYYGGTENEWEEISISLWGNDALTAAPRYYYSQTEPTTAGNYWHYVSGVPTKW